MIYLLPFKKLSLRSTMDKPKHRTRQSPIDFVVSLQLEECVYRIKQHHKKGMMWNVTASTDTSVDLKLVKSYKSYSKAEAFLHVKRWEGTGSRFQGTMNYKMLHSLHPLTNVLGFLLLTLMLPSVFAAAFVCSVLLRPIEIVPPLNILAMWVVYGIFWIVVWWAVFDISKMLYRRDLIKPLQDALK
jgi:hypothetical protein